MDWWIDNNAVEAQNSLIRVLGGIRQWSCWLAYGNPARWRELGYPYCLFIGL